MGIPPDIHYDIPDPAVDDLYQLRLRLRVLLEVQSSDDAANRGGEVVLHPREWHACLLIAALVETLQEQPPVIRIQVGLDD